MLQGSLWLTCANVYAFIQLRIHVPARTRAHDLVQKHERA
jgi:hypothetical protein